MRRAGEGRLETTALYAATVACYSDMYLTQPGLTVSAVVLAIAVASTFYGPLSDALGRKRVMVGAAALLAIPTALCAATRSFAPLLALRAAQGALIPGVTAVSIAFAGDHVDRRRLTVVVGGIIAASVAGGLLGRVAGGLIAAAAGWRTGFLVFGAFTLGAAALLALGLR